MTLKEVRRDGVLLEVNRQLLHPRGMALTASVATEATTSVHFTDDGIVALCDLVTKAMDAGIISENNAAALSARVNEAERAEPGELVTLYVQEDDDPEGLWFGGFDADDLEGASNFQARFDEIGAARRWALGFDIEPMR